jgi:hypothetical protein
VNRERIDLNLVPLLRGLVAKAVNQDEDDDCLVLSQLALDGCQHEVYPWLHVWWVLTVKLRYVLVNLRSLKPASARRYESSHTSVWRPALVPGHLVALLGGSHLLLSVSPVGHLVELVPNAREMV